MTLFVLNYFLKTWFGTLVGVYKHPRTLYTKTRQSLIYFVATVIIGSKTMNKNQYNKLVNATWDMFPLSVGIEYAMISMGKSTPIREQKVADAIGLGINGGD